MKVINVLVIASHPDDEVLGVGGTIARLSAEGHDVYIAILSTGVGSRESSGEVPGCLTPLEYGFPRPKKEEVQKIEQAIKIGKDLGVQSISVDGLPDNSFDTRPLLKIVKMLEKRIAACSPKVVYTHHKGDVNQDHRSVYEATLIATRPVPGCTVKEVYSYEVPSSTEWAYGDDGFQPNVFQEITPEHLDKKIAAMEMYETERRTFPHPRSPEALRALAMWRGAQSGCMAAEAFQLVRAVR